MWKDGPPVLYVGSPSQDSEEPDECAKWHPEVFLSCAVTWARSKTKSEQSEVSEQISLPQADISEGKELFKLLTISLPSLV